MTKIMRLSTLAAAVGALSACLGGEGTSSNPATGMPAGPGTGMPAGPGTEMPTDPGVETPVDPGLNIGTTSLTQSSNGMPFAADIPLDGLQQGMVRLVRLSQADPSETPGFQITSENFTYDPKDTFDTADDEITVTIAGAPVVFTFMNVQHDTALFQATSGGRDYRMQFASDGEYSYVVNVFDVTDDRLFQSFAIAGLQTHPNALPTTHGTVTYSDDFNAYGAYRVNNDAWQPAALEMNVTIGVDFATGGVNGRLYGDVVNFDDDYHRDFELVMDETNLQGTGFHATMAACTPPTVCESNSAIGGAFFGPNAEELSGVTTIDVTTTFDHRVPGSDDGSLPTHILAVGGYTAITD